MENSKHDESTTMRPKVQNMKKTTTIRPLNHNGKFKT